MGKPKNNIQNRRTPPWLVQRLGKLIRDEYDPSFTNFALDAAASELDTVVANSFLTKEDNGLTSPWTMNGWTFCNPTFENFDQWVEKAIDHLTRHDGCSVLIGPVGCSQNWFKAAAPVADTHCPSKRISYLLPDGTPTTGADRDTHIFIFAPEAGWKTRGPNGTIYVSMSILDVDEEVREYRKQAKAFFKQQRISK
jgi:phage N-6-adenine-methyltransferase